MERLGLKIKRIIVLVDPAMEDWRKDAYAFIILASVTTTSMEKRHLLQLWLSKICEKHFFGDPVWGGLTGIWRGLSPKAPNDAPRLPATIPKSDASNNIAVFF